MTGEGGEGGGTKEPFFCFRSNFRPITRLETLASQVICLQALTLSLLSPRVFSPFPQTESLFTSYYFRFVQASALVPRGFAARS